MNDIEKASSSLTTDDEFRWLLQESVRTLNMELFHALVSNPHTPEVVLSYFIENVWLLDHEGRSLLCCNENVPGDMLAEILLNTGIDEGLRYYAGVSKNVPVEVIKEVAQRNSYEACTIVSSSPHLSEEELKAFLLSNNFNIKLVRNVFCNPSFGINNVLDIAYSRKNIFSTPEAVAPSHLVGMAQAILLQERLVEFSEHFSKTHDVDLTILPKDWIEKVIDWGTNA